MENSETFIVIMFLIINIQTGVIMGLLNSLDFWKRKVNGGNNG